MKAVANRADSAVTFPMLRSRNLRAASCSLMVPVTGSTNGFLRLYTSLASLVDVQTR